ncbi:MAG: hypothetical protein PWP24_1784 [Clostridiales bacterium]|nr:hypothetical protein [Clostridiales bacterium]
MNAFQNRRPKLIGEDSYPQYAVSIPLVKTEDGICLVFEKRAKKLRRQPGEICFPGGKLEEGESLVACALRETKEELLILEEQMTVIGPGDIFLSPFRFMIHSFLVKIDNYRGTYSSDEVEEILTIPLAFFYEHEPQTFQSILKNEPSHDFPYEWIPGGENYPWLKGSYDILFYRYGEETIWGMTAQLLKSAVELVKDYDLITEVFSR